jgi:hypothetical protein
VRLTGGFLVNTVKVHAVIIRFVTYRIVNVRDNFDAGVDIAVVIDFGSLMDLGPPYSSETHSIKYFPVHVEHELLCDLPIPLTAGHLARSDWRLWWRLDEVRLLNKVRLGYVGV